MATDRIKPAPFEPLKVRTKGLTIDDLAQASKAIFDQTKEHLQNEVGQGTVRDLLQKEVQKHLGGVFLSMTSRFEDLMREKTDQLTLEYRDRLDSARKAFSDEAEDMRKSHRDALTDLSQQFFTKSLDYEKSITSVDAERNKAFDEERAFYKSVIAQMTELMKSIAAPVVHVAAPEFPVNVVVHPDIRVPDVHVAAPIVNVTTPEVAVKNLLTTPRREKFFQYDDYGRPLRTWEEDIKE